MKQFLQFRERFTSALLRATMLVALLFGVVTHASAQSQVTGKVTDKDGLPLIGATIVVSGTNIPFGTISAAIFISFKNSHKLENSSISFSLSELSSFNILLILV